MHRLVAPLFLALAFVVPTTARTQSYVNHPRLLFSSEEILALVARVSGSSTSSLAFQSMRRQGKYYVKMAPDTLLATLEGLITIPELALTHVLNAPLSGVGKGAEPSAVGDPSRQGVALSGYGLKAREVVLHLARTRDVDGDDFNSSLRLRSLALGYDMVFEEATAAEQQEVRDELLSYLDFMPQHYEYYRYNENPHTSNRGMMVGAAMGLAVLALWGDVSPAQQATLAPQLDFAHGLVVKCLSDILAGDGSYREGVLYAGWMLRHAIPYIEARKRFDGLDLGDDPRLERVAEWLCYEVLPEGGGRTNNLNDSLWETRPLAVHSTYLDWAQMRYGNSLGAWVRQHVIGEFGYNDDNDADRVATVLWNEDVTPANPSTVLENGRLFADRGIYFYRSGWKNAPSGDEILLSFHSSPFFGGHAQEDQNSLTLVAYGDRYIVDHGSPNSSRISKQTEAHNVVLIDDRGQHNAGNSIGTDGHISEAVLTPSLDYLCGDASSAYSTYSPFNAPDVPFAGTDWSWGYDGGNPVERADRLLVSIKGPETPPYFLLADDIRKDAVAHEYAWLLHTDAANLVDHSKNPVVITGTQSSLQVVFVNPRHKDGLLLDSWPFEHGGKDPASTTLRARCTAVEPAFFVALLPRTDEMTQPTIEAHPYGMTNASELRIDWGTVRDDAMFNPDRLQVAGAIATNGRLAFVRSMEMVPTGYLLADGSLLLFQGQTLLLLGEAATAVLSGDTLHLSRQDVSFIAHGTGINEVLGPDGPIAFQQDGGSTRSASTTDIGDPTTPTRAILGRNWPNPFNAGTQVHFELPRSGAVRVRVFDMRGRLVRVLLDAVRPAGNTSVYWDGSDAHGRRQASGTYVVQLESDGIEAARKIVVVR